MTSRFSLKRCILAVLLLALISGLSLVAYRISDYFDNADKFSGDIARGDVTAAREHMANLEYYHKLNKNLEPLRLNWIAEEYLFKQEKFHRAGYLYISKDWTAVINELEGEEEFWAYYIRANARWRQAKDMFANGLNLGDLTKKVDQLKKADEIAKSTKDDYLEAIKTDPNETHEPRWNYDLVTDDEARAKALMPMPGKIKIELGVPMPGAGGTKEGPRGEDGKGEQSNKPKDLDKQGGGPGDARGKPRRAG